jgi:hypothetical protein
MAVLHWKIGAVAAYLDPANWIKGVALSSIALTRHAISFVKGKLARSRRMLDTPGRASEACVPLIGPRYG